MTTKINRRKWTPTEDEKLRQMTAAGLQNEKIALDLNRTTAAVYSRRRRLNLYGPKFSPNEWKVRENASTAREGIWTSAGIVYPDEVENTPTEIEEQSQQGTILDTDSYEQPEDLAPETDPGWFPTVTKSYFWGAIKITKYKRFQQ